MGNKNPNIEYAEPDYIFYVDSTIPNDPYFNNLWGLHNTGQTGGTLDVDVDAPGAWDLTTGSNNVVVAVIDTGVDYNHEDLNANMWTNSGETPGNGLDDDDNGYVDDYYGINSITDSGDPMDDAGHGSHCSGTIAGVGNNGIGVVGVCWTARIMALKFLSSSGSGSTSNAIKCIEYAINKGAHVTSNSWGGGGFSQALKDAIEASKDAGILFIAAAGNSGTNNDEIPHYPSSFDCDNIIAVAATDHNDNLASFSCFGPYSVDVAAPGVSTYSTIPNNNYDYKSGTSMATPHVAGLAALIKSYESSLIYNLSLNWQEIKSRILNGVDQIASLEGKILTGGRINAFDSLTSGDITSYTLNIQSSPSTDAYIEVSPSDLNGQGDGYTNFTRVYTPYATVTLTAPETHNGRNFGYWEYEGARYSEEISISITIEYNHTLTAVYPLWTLTVESSPDTDAYIDVNPNDENGQGDGYTNFTREYHHGTSVTLTAPAEHEGKKFVRWLDKDGDSFDTNLTTSITVDNDYHLEAYYSNQLKWQFKTESENGTCSAIDADGTIYFGSRDSYLYAFNPDGAQKWKFGTSSSVWSSPAIGSDGTIYFGSDDYRLYAINPDGSKKWEFLTGHWVYGSPAVGSDGTIYFGSEDYKLYALNPDGSKKWEFSTGDDIISSPAISSDGTIYIGSFDNNLYAINPDGTQKWKFGTSSVVSQ